MLTLEERTKQDRDHLNAKLAMLASRKPGETERRVAFDSLSILLRKVYSARCVETATATNGHKKLIITLPEGKTLTLTENENYFYCPACTKYFVGGPKEGRDEIRQCNYRKCRICDEVLETFI